MGLSKALLKIFGWSVNITVPDYPKAIICVAPHTSNWDFILGKLAYASVGRKAGFLMKSSWFFFPLGYLFRAMGGIPVVRKNKKQSVVETVTELFATRQRLNVAVTPEGTRSANPDWKTGFLRIAINAGVPVLLGVLDYGKKQITITEEYCPTGDIQKDMAVIKEYYKDCVGKYPDKFKL